MSTEIPHSIVKLNLICVTSYRGAEILLYIHDHIERIDSHKMREMFIVTFIVNRYLSNANVILKAEFFEFTFSSYSEKDHGIKYSVAYFKNYKFYKFFAYKF